MFQWISGGVFQYNYTFVISGVIFPEKRPLQARQRCSNGYPVVSSGASAAAAGGGAGRGRAGPAALPRGGLEQCQFEATQES